MKNSLVIPCLILIFTFNLIFTPQAFGQCNLEDWQTLQTLYAETDGASWMNNTGWDQVDPALHPLSPPASCDLGLLHGITLDGSGNVVAINLPSNHLHGLIPEELGSMTNLTSLLLNDNHLMGGIPASFAGLSNLTAFNVSNNMLSGCFDADLANSSNTLDALQPGGTVYTRPTTGTLVVTDFDPTKDQINVGPESVHTQIMIDGSTGLTFENMFNSSSQMIFEGIFLKDLKWFNFTEILDAHFQQDISSVLALENCTGLQRPNTVYVTAHKPNVVEVVPFNPATDVVSFFYLSVRADGGVNFTTEQTPEGARFYSPYTGQSLTLAGVDFSDLNSSHFEFRANQLEDNIAGRMALDAKIANFQIDQNNVFNGKSVPMAGGVDQAPYHIFSHSEYTGTPICTLPNSSLCNFTDAEISDGNNFNHNWSHFCQHGMGTCSPPTVTIASPVNNANFQVGTDITISATATDTDGSIAAVEIEVDGSIIASTDTGGGVYEGTWTANNTGTFTITVTVTDNDGFTEIVTAVFSVTNTPPQSGSYNYGEVLQKSLFFYEAQQAGPLSPNNRVTWRGDAAIGDSDGSIDLTGGWFDAGDHVKFGFPMAYSATILAWSGIENQAAYSDIGQWSIYLENLRHVNDYLLKCHVRNTDGSTDRFYGQVGNGSADHAWWGPAEVMQMNRPAYYVDAANPGSDLTGETAAAMAAASMIFANTDPAYSATLLDNAIALYNFADTYRGKYSDAITDATGYYNSWSGYQDELVWGAIWLYRATGDAAWLTKAETEYAFLSNEAGSNVRSYTWTLAWDDKSYGCYALMAQLTGQQVYKDDTERWLDYWSVGYNGQQINYSPGGQAHLDTWGSLRYAANTSFVALLYADVIAGSNPTKSQAYIDFATNQINYALGSNPNNRSYVCGFGNNPPVNPHHRTAHGSWANSIGTPTETRHILYGALVGGPGSPNDQYTDDRGDYISNEVACDYNAGFMGAIANLLGRYGGSALPNFPEAEVYDVCEEYFNEAKINATGSTFTEVAVYATNHSAWPATETDQVCYRYFVDLSEGFTSGYSAADYIISLNNTSASASASALTQWDGDVYYVEVCFPNINIYPGGQSESRKEAQLRIALPNNAPASAWDPTNDWSYYDNMGTPLDNSLRTNTRIPFYNDGELLCGDLPAGGDQNTPPVASFTADPIVGNAPLYVSFDASASYDADGDMLTYTWDLTNGHVHYGVTTSRSFTVPGTHTVTLTVDDGNGGTDVATTTITVVDDTPQPPTAVIAANPTNGGVPLTVDFDGTGSSDPNADVLTYFWDFGDGNTSTLATVSHTYTAIGTYTATLTVDDGNGGSDTATETITVTNTPPTASFTASPNVGQPPLAVDFDASASSDANGDPLTYTWDFGDGNTATGVTTTHTYQNEGVYTATLTVDDGNGGSDTATETITVANTPPTASFTVSPNSGQPPLAVIFDAATSSDADGDPLTYTWDFGDGNTATGVTTTHIYQNEGVYTATLTVDDGNGGTDAESNTITVSLTTCSLELQYKTPDANAGGATDNQVRPHLRVHNNGSDPIAMQDITIRYWYTREGAEAQNVWIDYASVGSSNVTTNFVALADPVAGADHYLEVGFTAGAGSLAAGGNSGEIQTRFAKVNWSNYDENDDHSYNMSYDNWQVWDQVTVYCNGTLAWGTEPSGGTTPTNTAPVAVASATPTSGTVPLDVQFDASNSYDIDGDNLTYNWNFGDGNTSMASNPLHTYTAVGTYTAVVTVSDGNGGSDTEAITITVEDIIPVNTDPVAVASATPTSGTVPLDVQFDARNSYDIDGDNLTYNWNFGDGNTSTASNPQHTYTAVGTYTVTVTVSDGNGGSDTEAIVIIVDAVIPVNTDPVAVASATPTSGTVPLDVQFDAGNSYDIDGDNLTYNWNFGDGSTSTASNPLHTYTAVGIYTAVVTVSDGNGGSDTEAITITVEGITPINTDPVAVASATPTSGTVPLDVQFDASNSYDIDGDNLTYNWNFGDGNTSTASNPLHTYTAVGTYTATLTVSDGNGGSDSEAITITVDPAAGGGDIEIIWTVNSSWGTGYCARVEIRNNGTSVVNGWTLDFSLDASINNLWNANWSNLGGNNYTASNLSWNATIASGNSRSFGYCAGHSGSVVAPTNGVFNGVPVTITFVNNTSLSAPNGGGTSAVALAQQLVIQPNVTRDRTTIKYELPLDGAAKLLLVDQNGRLVRTLLDGTQMAGVHTLDMQTNDLAAGMYFVRLVAPQTIVVKRLIVVR